MASLASTSVGVLGAGWFGLALVKQLLASGGKHAIRLTCTTEEKADRLRVELADERAEVVVAQFSPDLQVGHDEAAIERFFSSEVVVVCIPPRLRSSPAEAELYVKKIRSIRELCERFGTSRVIFVSTTSVYPDSCALVTEDDRLSDSPFLQAEQTMAGGAFSTTTLRFSGLMGYDRMLGKYLAGRQDIDGAANVNYVHRDDCVALAEFLIDRPQLDGQIYNVTTPVRRTRKEVLEKNIADFGLAKATYKSSPPENFKIVSIDKLLSTGFSFRFADPLDFAYSYTQSHI